jgi:hypothetical protein
VKPYEIEGDDHLKSKKWVHFLKDCAFYFDKPNVHDEREMRFNLQGKYDDLFEKGWRPPLENRRELLLWGCEQHNAYLDNHKGPQASYLDCTNYNQLLTIFGPDYDKLKVKLNYVKGLFDDK